MRNIIPHDVTKVIFIIVDYSNAQIGSRPAYADIINMIERNDESPKRTGMQYAARCCPCAAGARAEHTTYGEMINVNFKPW
jgi:hypothetical protein